MIWKQIDIKVLSITLHHKQALPLLQSTGKRMCIPFQMGWKYTELTTIFLFLGRWLYLFMVFSLGYIYSLVQKTKLRL